MDSSRDVLPLPDSPYIWTSSPARIVQVMCSITRRVSSGLDTKVSRVSLESVPILLTCT